MEQNRKGGTSGLEIKEKIQPPKKNDVKESVPISAVHYMMDQDKSAHINEASQRDMPSLGGQTQ